MNIDRFDEERFRAINALGPDEGLQAGQRIKIIRE